MQGSFVSDIDTTGQYYGVLIRSTIERGYLVDIRCPALDDGYHLYSATDIPGENRLSAMGTSIPIFTPYEIQYYGEPLGILVGPDLGRVQSLVCEVLIETEPLKPLQFTDKFSGSQIIAKRVLVSGNPDAVLSKRKKVHETHFETGPQDHYYAEPIGTVVSFDKERLLVRTATQWPYHVRKTVSAALDLDPADIVVSPTISGETMDGKIWYPSLLSAQAALAAVLCKHPVKIMLSRQEDFLFTVKSAPARFRYRTVLDDDGTIEAMDIRILINGGAYSPLIDEVLERIAVSAPGLYSVPAWRIEVYALRTSLPPMGALCGWGEGQAIAALENHLSAVIADEGYQPIEWKLLNTGSAQLFHSQRMILDKYDEVAELFTLICSASDFPRKNTAWEYNNRLNRQGSGHPVRGIGLAFGFQGNGFLGGGTEQTRYTLQIRMNTDSSVVIEGPLFSPALRRVITEMTITLLGIARSEVSFIPVVTGSVPPNGPNTLSTQLCIMTQLVEKCCQSIQKLRFRQPLPITVKKTWKPGKNDVWDSETMTGKPFFSATPAVCVAEVELDPYTYEVRYKNIWLAVAAGTLLSKEDALATLKRTTIQAASRLTAERVTIKDGRLVPVEGIAYDLLPAVQVPEPVIQFLDSTAPARGIGSLAHTIVPAAALAAIRQITGKTPTSLPISPESLFKALHKPEEG